LLPLQAWTISTQVSDDPLLIASAPASVLPLNALITSLTAVLLPDQSKSLLPENDAVEENTDASRANSTPLNSSANFDEKAGIDNVESNVDYNPDDNESQGQQHDQQHSKQHERQAKALNLPASLAGYRDQATDYARQAKSKNTRRAYASDGTTLPAGASPMASSRCPPGPKPLPST